MVVDIGNRRTGQRDMVLLLHLIRNDRRRLRFQESK